MARWLNGSRRIVRRMLPLTMACVVAIFVATSLYTELLLTDDVDALDIASNSAPSIAELANARGELRAVGIAGYRVMAAASPAGAAAARTAYDEHHRKIEAALAEYANTPFYTGEIELFTKVKSTLAYVDAAMREGTAAPEGELVTAVRKLDEALDDLDAAIYALSELNRRHLQTSATTLARRGHRRNRYAFVLDGVGILVAVMATVVAARTVDRYLETLARRARELEHLAIEVSHEIATPLTPIELALGTDEGGAGEPNHAGMARARRAVQRIRASLGRLTTFAAATRPPEPPLPHTPLLPSLRQAARENGFAVVGGDPNLAVPCSELVLASLLRDLFASCVTPGGAPLEGVEVEQVGRHVRVTVARQAPGDPKIDPFDPQLHVPDREHPGLDLRLATVRRLVEACGGQVGVSRRRRDRREHLWIELPLA